MSDDGLTMADLFEELPPDHRSGFVAVVGRPNVGKSTLMNALLGQKIAIVSPRPQTTRNRIMGILTEDALQAIFVDTPGIHEPENKLGEFMVEEALAAMPDADLILWVTDVRHRPHADDERVAAVLRAQSLPVLLILNKIDDTPPADLLAHADAYRALLPDATADCAISALRDQGLGEVVDLLRAHLPLGPRYYPEEQVTDVQERFLAAELVREQVLLHIKQEVPHAVAVDIQEFKRRPNGMIYIAARRVCGAGFAEGHFAGQGRGDAQTYRQRRPRRDRTGVGRVCLPGIMGDGQTAVAARQR